ncbi:hypothetical protein L1887_62280 [Cichorium endivia]|nr:hypothetical protein L1887_62280 [Cichorium endivia]
MHEFSCMRAVQLRSAFSHRGSERIPDSASTSDLFLPSVTLTLWTLLPACLQAYGQFQSERVTLSHSQLSVFCLHDSAMRCQRLMRWLRAVRMFVSEPPLPKKGPIPTFFFLSFCCLSRFSPHFLRREKDLKFQMRPALGELCRLAARAFNELLPLPLANRRSGVCRAPRPCHACMQCCSCLLSSFDKR